MDAETQEVTLTQQSQQWIESQQLESQIWGRLYSKNRVLTSLDLCKEKFTAGRAGSCDLILDEKLPKDIFCRISKIHFCITRNLDNRSNPVYIQDLSRNGTFVNGRKLGTSNKRILQNNDSISLANPNNKIYVFKDLNPDESVGYPADITKKYYISRKLGSGACGVVKLIYNVLNCNEYAMKHVPKNRLAESTKNAILNNPDRVLNEAKIMKTLEHPCIIKMVDIIDKPDSVYMVLELMKGGDLLSRIINNKRLTENLSKLYFYQMCHAVKYLHDKGITHRDLKPDNILLQHLDDETLLKVSDFGLSKFVQNNSLLRTVCGTPLYVAPEILLTGGRGSYTKQVDIWSLGVVLFTCLSGTLPFSDDYGSPAIDQIKSGKFRFLHESWRNVSLDVRKLIFEMLTVDPKKRPSIEYVLRNKWLQDTEMIRKANALMGIASNENCPDNVENYAEPPMKKARR